MKRSKKKLEVMKASGIDTNLPAELRRAEYFARMRGKHAKGYMKFIARKGALVANAKRKAQAVVATG